MARSALNCAACFRKALQGVASSNASITAPSLYQATRTFATEATATTTDAPRNLTAGPVEPSVYEKKQKQKLDTAVKKHLKHMSDDPWAIGQYVSKALARDAFDEALLLVQKASGRGNQLTVAWNHLIDYQLNQQQIKRALKLFNDMKKRAQLPNVQTFTVLFRGLSKSKHPKIAVAEAVKHYNVLLNDSRLEPNSIHLNAVLNVCAKAGDLDNMFLIANTVNESSRSPTAFTYTTILNALRHNALNEQKGLSEDQIRDNTQQLLERAKSLWTEVISKWKAGRLVIDEELVCAMGRLLLMSKKTEEKLQILDLLDQTMQIPNMLTKQVAVNDGPEKALRSRKGGYAAPGPNTLSLVLTALTTTRRTDAGMRYWNLMVDNYGIQPDRDIFLRKIGMLKAAKSSINVTSTLRSVPDAFIDDKAFQIGMATCLRDCRNHMAMNNATEVFKLMLERLKRPDLYTMRLFLRLALVSNDHLRAKAKAGDKTGAVWLYGVQIRDALALLWEPYKQMHYHYFKEMKPKTEVQKGLVYNGKREVIALARQMVSASDKLVNEKMLSDADFRDLERQTAKINREIKAFFDEREKHEPDLPSAKGKSQSDDKQDGTADNSAASKSRDDEFTIKIGPQWVWDTYKPLK